MNQPGIDFGVTRIHALEQVASDSETQDDMSGNFKLSPLVILIIVNSLVIGELAAGTSVSFVSMMAIAVLSACITYNLLGGLGTISGLAFSAFVLNNLIISQFAKVILFEPADMGLLVPQLTITVYAVYYLFLMLGVFAFGWIRLNLPRPVEPDTSSQSRSLYLLSLSIGLPSAFLLAMMNLESVEAQQSLGHGFVRAFAYLLPFSLVIAVDNRIRSTGGRHCFGWAAVWPATTMMLLGFIDAGRMEFLEAPLIIIVACYMRGYKFRFRHYAIVVATSVVFFLFVSPYYLWSRSARGAATLGEQASRMVQLLVSAPQQWETIRKGVESGVQESVRGVQYYSKTDAVTLSRFSLIAPDSSLIEACSHGFHYGFTALKLDILNQLPRFLYKNKTGIGSEGYLGHLDGLESDEFETTYSTITPIPDSFGSFGWLGVITFSFLVVPAIFIVYESIFDMSRPWGTVTAIGFFLTFIAGTMGGMIMGVMIKTPIYMILISWFVGGVSRVLPAAGDRPGTSGIQRNDKRLLGSEIGRRAEPEIAG